MGSKPPEEPVELRKPWFARSEKIPEQLQNHRQWGVTVRGELIATKVELEKAIAAIDPSIADMVKTEVKLMRTRVKASRLRKCPAFVIF